jgi:hypothetical protein
VSTKSGEDPHPFNIIVGSLEAAGADILFAAGNCGTECPDDRCQGVTNAGIFGANSSPAVTCVAGVVTSNRDRIGYSTKGPGRLERKKPDVASFTHFAVLVSTLRMGEHQPRHQWLLALWQPSVAFIRRV